MKNPRSIIIAHLLTEKYSALREERSAYVFQVTNDANKIDIKNAVENLFNVQVSTVRTIITRGKIKRLGRFTGKRPNWKKAVVCLKQGQTITQLDSI